MFNHWLDEVKFAAKIRHYEVDEKRARLDAKYGAEDLPLKNLTQIFYTYLYFTAMAPFLLLVEYMYKLLRKTCNKVNVGTRQFQRNLHVL